MVHTKEVLQLCSSVSIPVPQWFTSSDRCADQVDGDCFRITGDIRVVFNARMCLKIKSVKTETLLIVKYSLRTGALLIVSCDFYLNFIKAFRNSKCFKSRYWLLNYNLFQFLELSFSHLLLHFK